MSVEEVGGLPPAFMERRFLILTVGVEFCLNSFCKNHCPEAAMPKQSAYITQGRKGCCSRCCAFKEVVKYGSAIGGTFALLPVTLSPSLSIPPSSKNGLCLQGPHHLPADIQDMIDEWPQALSRLCQLLIIYTSYLCHEKKQHSV